MIVSLQVNILNYNDFVFRWVILKEVDISDSNKESIIDLYRKSFPHKERDSIHKFLNHDGKDGRILTFYDENTFVGFVCLIEYKDIICILYLAISPLVQHKGYGHMVLEYLKTLYPNHRFIADIEKDIENCINHEQRKRRELFYLHDDYMESGIEYKYKGVDYIIMVSNGNITKEEFKKFWKHFSYIDDLGRFISHNF